MPKKKKKISKKVIEEYIALSALYAITYFLTIHFNPDSKFLLGFGVGYLGCWLIPMLLKD